MKPTVLDSFEEDGGQRCVDLLKNADGTFAWAECRRDPEDATGWRTLSTSGAFPDQEAALGDAYANVGWLSSARDG